MQIPFEANLFEFSNYAFSHTDVANGEGKKFEELLDSSNLDYHLVECIILNMRLPIHTTNCKHMENYGGILVTRTQLKA